MIFTIVNIVIPYKNQKIMSSVKFNILRENSRPTNINRIMETTTMAIIATLLRPVVDVVLLEDIRFPI